METMNGEDLTDALEKVTGDDKSRLLKNVEHFVMDVVLPQLQSPRSTTLGGLCGVVIPPVRVTRIDKRQWWPPKTSQIDRYCFCHSDLAQQNILLDPKTLEPVALIDGEYSGFYPPTFESPLWKKHFKQNHKDSYAGKDRDRLIALLDEPGMYVFATHLTYLILCIADGVLSCLRLVAIIPLTILRSSFVRFVARFRSAISILLPGRLSEKA